MKLHSNEIKSLHAISSRFNSSYNLWSLYDLTTIGPTNSLGLKTV